MTMRGNLSLFDKFEKTKQALNASCDIVIELPLAYSMQRADIFSKNACLILSMANVDEIWIGSEQNDVSLYEDAYIKLEQNKNKIDELIKSGYSYKEATSSIINLDSNDQLGFSYYKAIKENNLNIKLKTIKRLNSNYLDKNPTSNNIASAMAIRNNLDLLSNYCPSYVNKNLIRDEKVIFDYLKYKILSSSPSYLKDIFFVDEGLENKLKEIISFDDLNSYVNHLTSKRYTSSRVLRMLYYVLFDIKKTDINKINNPNYIRVLGYNTKGKEYISSIKKDVNIITNIKEGINTVLDIEIKVTKIIDSIYNTNVFMLEQKGPVIFDK